MHQLQFTQQRHDMRCGLVSFDHLLILVTPIFETGEDMHFKFVTQNDHDKS